MGLGCMIATVRGARVAVHVPESTVSAAKGQWTISTHAACEELDRAFHAPRSGRRSNRLDSRTAEPIGRGENQNWRLHCRHNHNPDRDQNGRLEQRQPCRFQKPSPSWSGSAEQSDHEQRKNHEQNYDQSKHQRIRPTLAVRVVLWGLLFLLPLSTAFS